MSDPVNPMNIESILETIKKLLGLTKEYVSFDSDILVHINTVFSTLTQMGIGPKDGFTITGYEQKWVEYVTSSDLKTQQVKSYIYLKVKSLFDPSANGNITQAMDRAIAEMEYRLYIEEDNIPVTVTTEEI